MTKLSATVLLSTAVLAVVLMSEATAFARVSGSANRPVTTKEWQAVLSDWLAHHRFTKTYSCGEVVIARTHAPPKYKEGTPLVHALDVDERTACHPTAILDSSQAALAVIRPGMSDRQVAALIGSPVPWDSGPRTWAYKTSDGLRWCCAVRFDAGIVSRVAVIVSSSTGLGVDGLGTCKTPQATAVTVGMAEYIFTGVPSTIPCGTITFTLVDNGMLQHDLTVAGQARGPTENPGQTATYTVTLAPGSYTYQSDVGSDAANGMSGTFTVTG